VGQRPRERASTVDLTDGTGRIHTLQDAVDVVLRAEEQADQRGLRHAAFLTACRHATHLNRSTTPAPLRRPGEAPLLCLDDPQLISLLASRKAKSLSPVSRHAGPGRASLPGLLSSFRRRSRS
jgi:hypothetical protein